MRETGKIRGSRSVKFDGLLRTLSNAASDTAGDMEKPTFNPMFWLITGSVTLICYMSGPFGTFDALSGGLRLIYWALIVFVTAVMGQWTHTLSGARQWDRGMALIALAVSFGLCVFGVVVLVSLALLVPVQRFPGTLEIFLYSFPTAALILYITVLMGHALDAAQPTAPAVEAVGSPLQQTARPMLLERLEKFPNAQQVLALCAQDHYVEVITELGSELCLMRLKDAISETAPLAGLQTHRSNWVALSAVKKLETTGSNAELRLHNGRVLKVSQSRMKELKSLLE